MKIVAGNVFQIDRLFVLACHFTWTNVYSAGGQSDPFDYAIVT